MINYDSILSAFDGKPTLLQWLKMVKKALDESILKNVNITQNGQKVVFTFNFEDGTSISTPEVTLPKGDKGDTGTGILSVTYDHTDIIGDNTETYFKVALSNGVENTFAVFAKNGKNGINGNDGVSITGISAVGNEVVGDETLTTLRANYSNDTSDEFVVTAKNGKDAAGSNIYLHCIKLANNPGLAIYFNAYSKKNTLTLEEAFEFIPTLTNENIYLSNTKIPVCIYYGSTFAGVVFAGKILSGNVFIIKYGGVMYNYDSKSVVLYDGNFTPNKIVDTLMGENL